MSTDPPGAATRNLDGHRAIGRWLNPKRRNQAPTVDRGIRNARPIAQAGKPCCSRNWPSMVIS